MPPTRCEYSASKGAVSGRQETRSPEKGTGEEGWFLKGCEVKLDWVTKKAVARHMTHGATDAESGVKDCLK
jgi:hypothetical protein